jgi:hypothetical protein
MEFITYRFRSRLATLLCFDLPARSQLNLQSSLSSQNFDLSCSNAIFSLISDELLRLYNDSV